MNRKKRFYLGWLVVITISLGTSLLILIRSPDIQFFRVLTNVVFISGVSVGVLSWQFFFGSLYIVVLLDVPEIKKLVEENDKKPCLSKVFLFSTFKGASEGFFVGVF